MRNMTTVLAAAAMLGVAGMDRSGGHALPISKPEKQRREEAAAKMQKAEEKRDRKRQRNLAIEARLKVKTATAQGE